MRTFLVPGSPWRGARGGGTRSLQEGPEVPALVRFCLWLGPRLDGGVDGVDVGSQFAKRCTWQGLGRTRSEVTVPPCTWDGGRAAWSGSPGQPSPLSPHSDPQSPLLLPPLLFFCREGKRGGRCPPPIPKPPELYPLLSGRGGGQPRRQALSPGRPLSSARRPH